MKSTANAPDGAYRWLHVELLNTATRGVLTPYQLGGRHDHQRPHMIKNMTPSERLILNLAKLIAL